MSQLDSKIAGRVEVGRGTAQATARNGADMLISEDGTRQHRAMVGKGANGRSAGLTQDVTGRHNTGSAAIGTRYEGIELVIWTLPKFDAPATA
jgi:hypothetical protein